MNVALTVSEDGQLPLPDGIRERYGIKAGDVLRAVDIGGMIVLLTGDDDLAERLKEAEDEWLETDEDKEMLASLREERERYYDEHYGQQAS
ncbi:MAG: AbrB/MazE/SpoVT family DNA-binding domain-containing protein [Chloroflexi bacterium]|nr:AbrB/MazE/SpoVT family DNA-binding domain-containing protein [Chloroflexota bacterium]